MTWPPRTAGSAALLFAATAVAMTAALAPASAYAAAPAADTITVNWAGSGSPADQLAISLTASSPITSLSAQLNGTGTNNSSMTISSFTPPAGTSPSSGVWTSTSPVPWGTGAGELPLGIYTVTVTVSDQGGTTLTESNAPGFMNLQIEPSLTLAASPATIDYAHRSVTFSGSVTGTYPDGSTAPVQGAVVTVSPLVAGSGDSSFSPTTASDGTYSVTGTVLTWQWQASVTGGPTGLDLTANTEQIVDLTVTQDQLKLTAAAKGDVNYGKSDKVSGTVMYKSGSTWHPLSDYQVVVAGTRPDNSGVTTTTDTTGHFTATLADLKTSDYWTVSVGEASAYFNGASKSLTITVNWPAKITRVSERLNPFGVLSASGCIVYKVPNSQEFTSNAPLWVDYAPRPKGPWHVLGKMGASWNGTQMCPSIGANWTGHFAVRLANAWYRERIKAAPGIEPATSKPAHLWKYLTRIVRFHVSARSVPSGGSLTVSGRLEQHTGHWRGLKHHVVLIVLRPKGKSTWYWIAKPRTTASGHFSATFTDPVSATWSAVFEGGIRYFASAARTVFVKVGSTNRPIAESPDRALRRLTSSIPFTRLLE